MDFEKWNTAKQIPAGHVEQEVARSAPGDLARVDSSEGGEAFKVGFTSRARTQEEGNREDHRSCDHDAAASVPPSLRLEGGRRCQTRE